MARKRERREFFRRDCLMLCRCETGGFRFDGHIIDISYGGIGIVGTKKLPAEGDQLAVNILLPGSSIKLPSKVVWVDSKARKLGLADFGVAFLDSFPERQGKLARFFPQDNAVED
jgi:hypothetical protein